MGLERLVSAKNETGVRYHIVRGALDTASGFLLGISQEASLVRKLEELGIGRPSTYAPTISTIQARGYILKGENEGIERNYKKINLQQGKISSSWV